MASANDLEAAVEKFTEELKSAHVPESVLTSWTALHEVIESFKSRTGTLVADLESQLAATLIRLASSSSSTAAKPLTKKELADLKKKEAQKQTGGGRALAALKAGQLSLRSDAKGKWRSKTAKWTKFLFVLEEQTVTYFKKDKDNQSAGEFDLEGRQAGLLPDSIEAGRNIMFLAREGERPAFLEAESRAEIQEWLDVLVSSAGVVLGTLSPADIAELAEEPAVAAPAADASGGTADGGSGGGGSGGGGSEDAPVEFCPKPNQLRKMAASDRAPFSLLCGYLSVQSAKKDKWERHYALLGGAPAKDDSLFVALQLFRKPKDVKPAMELALLGLCVGLIDRKYFFEERHSFFLGTDDALELFEAESADHAEAWVQTLERATGSTRVDLPEFLGEHLESEKAKDRAADRRPASERTEAAMRGWLKKRQERKDIWNPRYFVLTDSELAYFSKDKEAKVSETIDLTGRSVGFVPDGLVLGEPAVIFVEGAAGERLYLLAAESRELGTAWIKAMIGGGAADGMLSADVAESLAAIAALAVKPAKAEKAPKASKAAKGPRKPSVPVFGIPLNALVAHPMSTDRGVPYLFVAVADYLRSCNGCKQEGIFRLSGAATDIERLRAAFETGEAVDLAGTDPFAAAAMIKYLLRELPEPLVPNALFLELMALGKDASVDAVVALVSQVPEPAIALLVWVLEFLTFAAGFAEDSKMTPANLAIVIGPNVLRRAAGTASPLDEMREAPVVNVVAQRMLEGTAAIARNSGLTGIASGGLAPKGGAAVATDAAAKPKAAPAKAASSSSSSSSYESSSSYYTYYSSSSDAAPAKGASQSGLSASESGVSAGDGGLAAGAAVAPKKVVVIRRATAAVDASTADAAAKPHDKRRAVVIRRNTGAVAGSAATPAAAGAAAAGQPPAAEPESAAIEEPAWVEPSGAGGAAKKPVIVRRVAVPANPSSGQEAPPPPSPGAGTPPGGGSLAGPPTTEAKKPVVIRRAPAAATADADAAAALASAPAAAPPSPAAAAPPSPGPPTAAPKPVIIKRAAPAPAAAPVEPAAEPAAPAAAPAAAPGPTPPGPKPKPPRKVSEGPSGPAPSG